MFIKGKIAIYIDKTLKVYENSIGIFVLCNQHSFDSVSSITVIIFTSFLNSCHFLSFPYFKTLSRTKNNAE